MPMSPRIKAKKGRFGVGGLVPSIRILTPARQSSVSRGGSPGSAVFTATVEAFDDINGDVSSQVVWTDSLDVIGVASPATALTGASVSVTLTTPGVHTLTATYTDGTNVVTDTATVTVT